MEGNHYLMMLGRIVREERKKRKMTQIQFFNYLFPEEMYSDESKKKKINAIERGKGVYVNYETLFKLHEKCDLSMDYMFGLETEFPNYETKTACEYTGLDKHTIQQLHLFAKDLNASLPSLSSGMTEHQQMEYVTICEKQIQANWVLKTIDTLFLEKQNNKGNRITNLRILFDLYMMSVTKPESVLGTPVEDNGHMLNRNSTVRIDINSLSMRDSFHSIHRIDVEKVHKEIWMKKLVADLDSFVALVNSGIKKE